MNLTDDQLDSLLIYAVTEADGLRASVLPAAQIRRDWAAGEIDGCPADLLSSPRRDSLQQRPEAK